ncbi:hypothetical protein CW696_05295 [ANME-2 cluster archaeon]|nr:MAG: hypothetical protein CW696_05295 [ANME-2 cluster archaeon]
MNKHRDLTDAEIANLSLEMRCCYFLHPWNVSMTGTTIAEWADQIGFMRRDSVSDAISEAEDLVSFVKAEQNRWECIRQSDNRQDNRARLIDCQSTNRILQDTIQKNINWMKKQHGTIDALRKQLDELEIRLSECRSAKRSLQGIVDTLLMDKDKKADW